MQTKKYLVSYEGRYWSNDMRGFLELEGPITPSYFTLEEANLFCYNFGLESKLLMFIANK